MYRPIRTWLKSLRKQTKKCKTASRGLHLEGLEDRTVPAFLVTYDTIAQVLTFDSDGANGEDLTIQFNSVDDELVYFDNTGNFFTVFDIPTAAVFSEATPGQAVGPENPISQIVINMPAGQDNSFNVVFTTSANLDSLTQITVNGQDGIDDFDASVNIVPSVAMLFNGGGGADNLAAGFGRDTLNGGMGDDFLVWPNQRDALIDGGMGDDTVTIDGSTDSANDFILTGVSATQQRLQRAAPPAMIDIVNAEVIDIIGGNESDSLVIDGSNSIMPIPVNGVSFDGIGLISAGLDRIAIVGDGANDDVTYQSDGGVGSGAFTVSDGSGPQTLVDYANLQSVNLSQIHVATVNFPNGDDSVGINEGFDSINGTNPALVVSGTSQGALIESVALFNNGNVNIDTMTVDGLDMVAINGAANTHGNTNFSIQTGTGLGPVPESISVLNPATFLGDASFQSGQILVQGQVTATNVTFDANAGAIIDNNSSGINVVATNFVASATAGIEADTTIGTLDATMNGTGNIDIRETDALLITRISNAVGGNASVNALGDIDVQLIANQGDVTLTTPGTITSPTGIPGGNQIAGNLNTLNGSISIGGSNPGQLSMSGPTTIVAGTTFTVDLNGTTLGTEHDQLSVDSNVTLSDVNLAINLGFATVGGEQFTIVESDGTTIGTFNGLGEGATVSAGGRDFTITYVGGTGGDVVLTAVTPPSAPETVVRLDGAGNLVIQDINGGTSDDALSIQSDTASSQIIINDPNLELTTGIAGATQPDINTVVVPFTSVTGSQILVDTLAGNDLLTIDFSVGNFTKTIGYTGGDPTTGPGDSLTLTGGATFANVTHTFTNASDGTIDVTGNGLITYTGLEPIADNLDATDRIFTFNSAANAITIGDDAAAGNGSSQVSSVASSETVVFRNPTNSVTVNAGDGSDSVSLAGLDSSFAGTLDVNAGDGDDQITFLSGIEFNGLIDGGTGADVLSKTDGVNGWRISGLGPAILSPATNSGVVNSTAFDNVESLVGGSDRDNFIIYELASVSGSIDGGGGANEIRRELAGPAPRQAGVDYVINARNGGTASGIGQGFSNVESLFGLNRHNDTFTFQPGGSLDGLIDGLLGADELIVTSGTNTWNITGQNGGTVAVVTGGFSGIEDLTGGSGPDNFIIGPSGVLTDPFSGVGNIDGGGGNNFIQQSNGTNRWNITGPNSGTVTDIDGMFSNIHGITGGSGPDNIVIESGGSLTGSVNGAGGDNYLGQTDGDNSWLLMGTNAGTVTDIGGIFANIRGLTGGSGDDEFTIGASAALSQSINGGGGSNTLIQSAGVNTFSITARNAGTVTDIGGIFANIQNLTGGSNNESFVIGSGGSLTGSIDGAAGNNFITQSSGINTWNITGAGSGTVTDIGGAFANILGLTGGSGADNFIIGSGGSLAGSINGGAGDNFLNQTDGANTWNITATNAGTVTDIGGIFANIHGLTGGNGADDFIIGAGGILSRSINGGAGTNSLTQTNGTNTWTLTATNAGTATDVGGIFANIQSLTGGTGNDNFIIGAGGSLSGSIDGAAGSNFIMQTNATNSWNITGADSGTVTDIGGTFANIRGLTGGSGLDSFVIGSGGSLSGSINGGGGSNFLTQTDATNNWNITAANAGTVTDIGGIFASIQGLTGGNGADNFVIGSNGSLGSSINGGGGINSLTQASGQNNWIVTGINTGTVTDVGGIFANIHILVGGSDAENFTINSGSNTIAALIDGGPGDDTFQLNLTNGKLNLNGNDGNDLFNFGDGAGFAGTLNGGDNTAVDPNAYLPSAVVDRDDAHSNSFSTAIDPQIPDQGDTLDYESYTSAIVVNLATGSATGVSDGAAGNVIGIENVFGGAGDDTISDNSGAAEPAMPTPPGTEATMHGTNPSANIIAGRDGSNTYFIQDMMRDVLVAIATDVVDRAVNVDDQSAFDDDSSVDQNAFEDIIFGRPVGS